LTITVKIDRHEFISTAAQMPSNDAIQLPPRNMSKITLPPANPWQTHVRGKKSIEKFLFGCSFQANTEKPFPISPWHTKFAGCQHSFLQYKQLLEQSCFRKGDPSMQMSALQNRP
jgi:hypothetical protein